MSLARDLATNRNPHVPWRSFRDVLIGLLAGLASGILIGVVWAALAPSTVPLEDYSVMLAAAYARERLPVNAADRLVAAGVADPVETVSSIAAQFRARHPDRNSDLANLVQLAEALRGSATGPRAKVPDNASWWRWPLLIAVVALVGAGIVAGRRLRARQLDDYESEPLDSVPSRLQRAGNGESQRRERDAEPGEQDREEIGVGRAAMGRLVAFADRRRPLVRRNFLCTYHVGDEPFENVHTILHDDDTLVGACGLTAAAKLETSGPARYYAFTAWAHDYLSGEPMRAVGLLSPWATGRKRLALYDPTLTQATLHRAEKGVSTTVETQNMFVTATVVDIGFGTARDVAANSYFTIISVSFDVTIKAG